MDTLHHTLTHIATLGQAGQLSDSRIKDVLLGEAPDRRKRAFASWKDDRNVAHMMWLVITWERANGLAKQASVHLEWAVDRNLHRIEPRLALLVCDDHYVMGRTSEARKMAVEVIQTATTDPGYQQLRDWLTIIDAHEERRRRATKRRAITHPRLARPDGRVNANPFLPADEARATAT